MVIMFQGTHTSNNCVTGAAATAAVLSAIKYNRKTLMIQLTGTGRTDMQMLLIGKQIEESMLVAEANALHRINDRGIDALMRRAEASKLVKEHFDSSCEPLLDEKKATENMLDIAGITKKEDFIETIQVDTVSTILKHAKEVYDNIFILLDGKNEEVMQEMLSLADVSVTCISQSAKTEKFNSNDKVRNILLVTDYEPTSAYSLRYLKSQYHDHVNSFPHNVGFKDACISGTLLEFLMKNYSITESDDNYDYMKNVQHLMESIMGKEKWEELDDHDTEMEAPEEAVPEELESCDSVTVTEQTVKKGLFGKKKVMQVVEETEPTEDEVLEEDEEFEEEEEVLTEEEDEDEEPIKEEEEEVEKPEPKAKHSLFGKKKKLPEVEKLVLHEEEKDEEQHSDAIDILGTISDDPIKAKSQANSLTNTFMINMNDERTKKDIWYTGAYNLLKSMMLIVKFDNTIPKEKRTLGTLYDILIENSNYVDLEMKYEYIKTNRKHPAYDSWMTYIGTRDVVRESILGGLITSLNFMANDYVKEIVSHPEIDWTCPDCGSENTGKFCNECGMKAPEKKESWICPDCGEENTGKFCSECGTKKPEAKQWTCPECGTENDGGKFCSECGTKR